MLTDNVQRVLIQALGLAPHERTALVMLVVSSLLTDKANKDVADAMHLVQLIKE